jgi:PIN like domain
MAVHAYADLTFVLDENLGSALPILRMARVQPEGMLTSLGELGFPPGTLDEVWISELGRSGNFVVITRDGEILNATVRRDAWRASGVRLLLLDKKWGLMPIRDVMRALFYWWPMMVRYAEAGAPGTAWTVTHKVQEPPETGIRLVTGPGPTR